MTVQAHQDISTFSKSLMPKVDVDFVMWLAVMAPAALAVICFLANFGGYLFNAAMAFLDAHVWMVQINHGKLSEASIIFALFAVGLHYGRLRLKARREAAYEIEFPMPLVARSLGADGILEKFECRAKVALRVRDSETNDQAYQQIDALRHALETGLAIAISDPITRFSKERIEHVLRVSIGELLDLSNVSDVVLRDVRQRRVNAEELAREAKESATTKEMEATIAPAAEDTDGASVPAPAAAG